MIWQAGVAVSAFLFLAGCAHAPPEPRCPEARKSEEAPGAWCAATQHESHERRYDVTGALSDLNGRFLEAHARSRQEACRQLESQRLVLRYSLGVLEGRYRGKPLLEGQIDVLPPEYHPLKDVSHAVFLAALLFAEPPGNDRTLHVTGALGATDAVLGELAAPGSKASRLIPPLHRDRQQRILIATRGALGAFLEGRLDGAGRGAYFQAVAVDLAENVRVVSAALVLALHRQVGRFRAIAEGIDPRAWNSVVVVVGVPHQARAREIGIQYFERLLSEPVGEGARNERRLVVAEGMSGAPDQYGLLATHLVDQAGATAVFNDALRLQRDVTGDDGGMLDSLLPTPSPASLK